MKRRLDPKLLQAHAQRGVRRLPTALSRYRSGARSQAKPLDRFPDGRYCLCFYLPCGDDFCELRVIDLYRGLLPWLAHNLVDRPQPWIDLVALIDELVVREDDWFDAAAPWPLVELRAAVGEAADVLAEQPNPYPPGELAAADYEALGHRFADLRRQLDAHAACCPEVHVNVHWW